MAISVYREGNSHVVNGVKCEIIQCVDVAEMNHLLLNGCTLDEKKLSKKEDMHPVRIQARDAGIENWDTARIKTLEAALNGTTEG